MPKISVCIAAYNGERYIREQVDSILCQLQSTDEIIISDDGSTDSTMSILHSYNDSRIKIIHHSPPKHSFWSNRKHFVYASANFQNALENATGDIIFLADQDDIWLPDKVERCKKELQEFDYVRHNSRFIDCNGKEIHHHRPNFNGRISLIRAILKLPFKGCCCAFTRKVLLAATPFPKECLQHDSWIGLLCYFSKLKSSFINDDLILYRIHQSNVSVNTKNTLFFKVLYRFILIAQVLQRLLSLSIAFRLRNRNKD